MRCGLVFTKGAYRPLLLADSMLKFTVEPAKGTFVPLSECFLLRRGQFDQFCQDGIDFVH